MEFNKRISDMYRPATGREQIVGVFASLFRAAFFLAVGYVIFTGIPSIIMIIGFKLDRLFGIDNVFLFISFAIIFLYVLYIGSQAKRHR